MEDLDFDALFNFDSFLPPEPDANEYDFVEEPDNRDSFASSDLLSPNAVEAEPPGTLLAVVQCTDIDEKNPATDMAILHLRIRRHPLVYHLQIPASGIFTFITPRVRQQTLVLNSKRCVSYSRLESVVSTDGTAHNSRCLECCGGFALAHYFVRVGIGSHTVQC